MNERRTIYWGYNLVLFCLDQNRVIFYWNCSSQGPSWSWLYSSLIYNYLCNQCLSSLILWVLTPFMVRCTRYSIMWYSLSVTCDRLVVFSRYSSFLHQQNRWPWYNWNIVESGIKHLKPKPSFFFLTLKLIYLHFKILYICYMYWS